MYNYHVSDTYITWLCNREAFSAKAYKDGYVNGVQSYSIGYGHQIQPNEQHLFSATWTKAQAKAQLIKDVKIREDYVNKNSTKPHTAGTFQACVDYAYNAGVGAVQTNVLALHNAGASKATVANNIRITRTTTKVNGVSVTSQELINRRQVECNWYNGSVFVAPGIPYTILLIIILPFFSIWAILTQRGKNPVSKLKIWPIGLGSLFASCFSWPGIC